MDVRAAFQSVGVDALAFRGLSLWSWNDELDPKEIRRQIREMRRAGLGGFVIQPRVGLTTPYLSEQWGRCVKVAVEESKAVGMSVWLCDEDCWPSGSAGGAVPKGGLEYQEKTLRMEVVSPKSFSPKLNTVATFLGVPHRKQYRELRRVKAEDVSKMASPLEVVLHFYYKASAGYADLLSATAVKRYIQSTHEKYRKWVGKEFGRTVAGFFTVEPRHSLLPWSFDLAKFFRKTRGDDLLDLLPSLVFRYGDYRKVRWQYLSAVNELFVQSYTKQLGEWCGKNRLALTGYLRTENPLGNRAQSMGAVMPHYEHMQVPGIEWSMRHTDDPTICREVSSAAHQFGRRRVLSTMFGGAGWNISFQEMKQLAEWQFALGISLPCGQVSPYSIRGCRKRDCPPALHIQQPWWDDYRTLNSTFARSISALTSGKRVVDILVLHPAESAYTLFDQKRGRDVRELRAAFVGLSRCLQEIQRDYDYGDEVLLSRHARVSGDQLKVGGATYSVVIIPRMITMRSSTLRLLKRFVKNGGHVVRTAPLPLRIDGEPSKAAIKAFGKALRARVTALALQKALNTCRSSCVEAKPGRGSSTTSLCIRNCDCDDLQVFFLLNTSPRAPVKATLRIRGEGCLERWDVESGRTKAIACQTSDEWTLGQVELPPANSQIIVLDKSAPPVQVATFQPRAICDIKLQQCWELRRLDPNSLLLDRCQWRADKGVWQNVTPLVDLQDLLARIERTVNLEMKFTVLSEIASRHGRRLWLAMEMPSEHTLAVNGRNIRLNDAGGWIDNAIRMIPLDGWNHSGTNEILLRRRFSGNSELYARMQDSAIHPAVRRRMWFSSELENVYLAGDFAVWSESPVAAGPRGILRSKGPFIVGEESFQCDGAKIIESGLPFYSGRVELKQSVNVPIELLRRANAAELKIVSPEAIVVAVHVNGKPVGRRCWRPYCIDVTEFVKEGTNEIAIVLTNSCRNMFGPHHHIDGEPQSVDAESFGRVRSESTTSQKTRKIWTDTYNLVRFGLNGTARISFYE